MRRAGRGGLFVIGGLLAGTVLRLVGSVIVARLLFPEAFGLMGMVNMFLSGLALFSDTGSAPLIVRSKRGEDPAFLATAWTVGVIRGVVLFALCWVLATPYARLFREPELARLLPLAGIVSILNGFFSMNMHLATRRLAQGRLTLVNLISQTTGLVTMIVWAWLFRSVEALVVCNLASAGIQILLSHTLLPGPRSYFHIEREALRELITFGRWILVSTALTFLSTQGDRLFLGWAVPLAPLGLYFIASRIVELATGLQGLLAASIVFPTWVESARLDPSTHVSRLQRSRRALDALGMAGLLAIVTLAPALFRLAYDMRYRDAALYAQLLCVPGWFEMLKASATSAVLTTGDSRALSLANLVLLLARIPACIAGFYVAGIPGLIIGAAVGTCVALLPLYRSLDRHGCRLFPTDVAATSKMLVLTGAGVCLPLLAAKQTLVPSLAIEVVGATALCLVAANPAKILLTMWRRKAAGA